MGLAALFLLQGLHLDLTVNIVQLCELAGFLVMGGILWQKLTGRQDSLANAVAKIESQQDDHDQKAKDRQAMVEELRNQLASQIEWRGSAAQMLQQQHAIITNLTESMIGMQEWRKGHSETSERQAQILDVLRSTVQRLDTLMELYVPRIPTLEATVASLKRGGQP